MKLRTELKDIRLESYAFGLNEMGHDAAAAHALLQAMKEIEANGCGCDPVDVPEVIMNSADELMREWFGQDDG